MTAGAALAAALLCMSALDRVAAQWGGEARLADTGDGAEVARARHSRGTTPSCPVRSSCNSHDVKLTFKDRNCFCDPLCEVYGDCCEDYIRSSARRPRISRKMLTCDRVREVNQVAEVYIVKKCPKNFADRKVRRQCERPAKDTFFHVPVSGRPSAILYQNYFCALCAGERDVKFWKIEFTCSSPPVSAVNLTDDAYSAFSDVIGGNDGIYGDAMEARMCKSNIDRCDKNFKNRRVKRLCQGKNSSTSYVYVGLKVFKNKYCAKCNFLNENVTKPSCEDSRDGQLCPPPTDADVTPPTGAIFDHTFTVLLNLNKGKALIKHYKVDARGTAKVDETVITTRRCATDHIYDPFRNMCRRIACSYGYRFKSGRCIRSDRLPLDSLPTPPTPYYPDIRHPGRKQEDRKTADHEDSDRIITDPRTTPTAQTAKPTKRATTTPTTEPTTAAALTTTAVTKRTKKPRRNRKKTKRPKKPKTTTMYTTPTTPYVPLNGYIDDGRGKVIPLPGDVMTPTKTGSGSLYDPEANKSCPLLQFQERNVIYHQNGSVTIPDLRITYDVDQYKYYDTYIYVCTPVRPTERVTLVHGNETVAIMFRFNKLQDLLSFVGTIVSLGCLLLTFGFYVSLPKLQTTHGNSLISLVFCLMVWQTFFLVTLSRTAQYWFCFSFALVFHYFLLAAFFWMNVMVYDIWHTFASSIHSEHSRVRYAIYSLYAWLTPGVVVGLGVGLEWLGDYISDDFQPHYGSELCWITRMYPLLLLVAAPVATLFIMNMVFLVLTARNIAVISHVTAAAHIRADRTRFILYFLLNFLLTATWACAFVATFTAWWLVTWYVFVAFNSLQGVFVCLAFCCTRKVYKLLLESHGERKLQLTGYSRAQTPRSNHSNGAYGSFSPDYDHSRLGTYSSRPSYLYDVDNTLISHETSI